MKKVLNSVLAEYLKKQRYPYLWEVELLSMLNPEGREKLKKFCGGNAIGQPKAAICIPQHPFKKSDEEIIAFIKSIQQNEKQVCIVVAHANYNPLDLQAIYVLDCKEGEEAECFHSVFERWSKCSELYFFAMNIDYVIKEIIVSNLKLKKTKKFFLKIVHLFKGHDDILIFHSNIYGDMIESCNGKRSIWECPSCGRIIMKDKLHD